jgi:hypothetical protein
MTVREALGGPWATHWALWLALYLPTTALILVRESPTNYPQWWWPLASATAQHLVTGIILVGGGALARRRWAILPLSLGASLWAVSALVRAVIGSSVAEHIAGVPGDLLFRLTSWLVITAAWAPALIYAIAQIDRRQGVIGELEQAMTALESARKRATVSDQAMRHRLVESVERSVAPVLDDLRLRLAKVRDELDPVAFTEINARLAQLHTDTSDLLDSATPSPTITDPPRRASLREVFDVHPPQPWLIAGLVTAEALALVLLDSGRIFGTTTALEIFVACVAAGAVLGIILAVAPAHQPLSRLRASTVILSAAGLAVVVQSWILLADLIDPVSRRGVLLAPIVALGFVAACTIVIAALVITRANAKDEVTLHRARSEVSKLDLHHEAALDLERHRLSELMHGPVQGRIAACVMALSFFTSPDSSREALARITDDVLLHLEAASRDLSQLAVASSPEAPA